MAADYTFDYFVAVDNVGNPAPDTDFTLYANPTGGSPLAMYDMNGSPISKVTTNSNGVGPRFRADVLKGYLDNGAFRLPAFSTAQLDALTQATAAQTSAAQAATSAQTAQTSAGTSATSAQTSATAAQQAASSATTAATGAVSMSRLGAGADSTKVLYGDATWRVPTGGGGGGADLSGYSLGYAWNYNFTTASWPTLPTSPPTGIGRLDAAGPAFPTAPVGWSAIPLTFLLKTS